MADFCKECSEEIFCEDMGDLAGLTTEEMTLNEEYAHVLCEGCGDILVDHTGKRVKIVKIIRGET